MGVDDLRDIEEASRILIIVFICMIFVPIL